MSKSKLYVRCILDETGSMMPVKADTIGGYNQYVSDLQRQHKEEGIDIEFGLTKFNSDKVTSLPIVPVAKVKVMGEDDYLPAAFTPLLDAIGNAIKDIQANPDLYTKGGKLRKGNDILVVIITDGQENASRKFDNTAIQSMIKEARDAGWKFAFIGSDPDSWSQARNMGIAVADIAKYDQSQPKAAFAATSSATLNYARTRNASMGFWDTGADKK